MNVAYSPAYLLGQTIETASYRLDDLKSGNVQVGDFFSALS